MIIPYLIILLFIYTGTKYNRCGIYEDYIEQDQCNAIKGICIMLVFIRHIFQYVTSGEYDFSTWGDNIAILLDKCTLQLLVVPFLFYSGYGVSQSILKKGAQYVDSIPHKRILQTLINFDIAVVLFVLLDVLIQRSFSTFQVMFSLIAWDSVGNSNWYIFAILYCYFATYIAYIVAHKSNKKSIGIYILFILSILYIIIMCQLKKSHWYNTILCYPIGFLYSIHKDKIESILKSNYWTSLLLATIFFVTTYLLTRVFPFHGRTIILCSIVLCGVIVCVTMKIKIENPILTWLGRNLFPLYIYQRIPMLAISVLFPELLTTNFGVIIYILVCMFITALFGYFYKFCNIKLN